MSAAPPAAGAADAPVPATHAEVPGHARISQPVPSWLQAPNPATATPVRAASELVDDDNFDWYAGEELVCDTPGAASSSADVDKSLHIKRGRRVYYFCCTRIPRPVRMAAIAIIGGGICLVPLIVVVTAFRHRNSPEQDYACRQVEVWSVWLTIIWVTGVATFLVFDWFVPAARKLTDVIVGRMPDSVFTVLQIADETMFYVKLLFCTVWAWASLSGSLRVRFGTGDKLPDYFEYIVKAIQSLFATAVVTLVEKVLLSIVAMNFHRTAIHDRLENNKYAFKVLSKLQNSRKSGMYNLRARAQAAGSNARRAFYAGTGAAVRGAQSVANSSRTYFSPREGATPGTATPVTPATPAAESAATELESRAKRGTFAAQLQVALAAAAKKTQLSDINMPESSLAAKRLAKELFGALSSDGHVVRPGDMELYFKTRAEAFKAFAIFDVDGNGGISKEEMRNVLEHIFEERRNINSSITDMKSAFNALDGVLMFLVLIIVIFIWLSIFTNGQTVSNLVPLTTIVVGFSFVFGNSAKNVFESMIFIFSTHPYDVGDLVCIDDVWMFVTGFHLLSTHFRTVFNETVIIPNAVLASSKYIYNSRRSGSQWEILTITIAFQTPLSKIDALRAGIQAYVNEHDRDWGGGLEIIYDSIRNMNALKLTIAVEHKSNWQDWLPRWLRRTRLLRHIRELTLELGITYDPPLQPISFLPREDKPNAMGMTNNGMISQMQAPPWHAEST
ncbi:hypothetical protein MCUN1_001465 [Malassezia cuniculi]|uniref:EF-hand domain-containing protein n=1 Tax=Malassezia cuniculi TaxID=948313 RepID=A0AAF0EU44_9BASI|nr:hypothetical protein MCUN1_001465 [Malassezia cuniculi]